MGGMAAQIPIKSDPAANEAALDKVRKERRSRATEPPVARATPRELVERLLKPAAENLSQRRKVQGKPTLSEDLARAGLNVTPPEYLLIRIGAVGLGALIGLFRFGFSGPSIVLGGLAAEHARRSLTLAHEPQAATATGEQLRCQLFEIAGCGVECLARDTACLRVGPERLQERRDVSRFVLRGSIG